MGSRVQTVFIRPTGLVQVSLRRYRSSVAGAEPCPGPWKYHNASTVIADKARPQDWPDASGHWPDIIADDDPRWPTTCPACGAAFVETDERQLNMDKLYRSADGAVMCTLQDAPVGAVWDAPWYRDLSIDRKRPDGMSLVAKCPDGVPWHIDGPASNGAGWERSGPPERLTVSPSIQTGSYHGFLQEGVFVEC